MVLLLVEGGDLLDGIRGAVHAHAHESGAADVGERLFVAPLAALDHGCVDDELRAGWELQDRLDDLLGALAADGLAAVRAVGHAHGAVEKTQVVVDLRDGGDDGARIAAGGALLDGDGGGQPLDSLDVRLLHLVEELPRVGGERFDVAALAFGVERVEREGGLAAAGEAGDDGERIARDAYVDAAQVVDLCAFNDDICHDRAKSIPQSDVPRTTKVLTGAVRFGLPIGSEKSITLWEKAQTRNKL